MNQHQKTGLRQQIAAEAARILADQDYLDYAEAGRKAASRLNCKDRRAMPSNGEIHKALLEYQELFLQQKQPTRLRELRELALQAMQSLEAFRPRLVGDVLNGSASTNSCVELNLYADTPEDVAHHLLQKSIPFQHDEVTIRLSKARKERRALFSFEAGGTRIELLILSPRDLNNPPIDPITERPVNGASIKRTKELLLENL